MVLRKLNVKFDPIRKLLRHLFFSQAIVLKELVIEVKVNLGSKAIRYFLVRKSLHQSVLFLQKLEVDL